MAGVDLQTREGDGHSVVALRGELDMADAVSVAAALAAVAVRVPHIIVDLAGLEFIDSSGVAALARGRNLARLAGGELLLAAPQQQVLRVLTLTRLVDVFAVHASAEGAAGSLGCSLPVASPWRLRLVCWPRAALRSGVRAISREHPALRKRTERAGA
jgi:anti-anti-sigma factor